MDLHDQAAFQLPVNTAHLSSSHFHKQFHLPFLLIQAVAMLNSVSNITSIFKNNGIRKTFNNRHDDPPTERSFCGCLSCLSVTSFLQLHEDDDGNSEREGKRKRKLCTMCYKWEGKAVQQHTCGGAGGRGSIAPTHSRPRH
jgi:hypothetical protein